MRRAMWFYVQILRLKCLKAMLKYLVATAGIFFLLWWMSNYVTCFVTVITLAKLLVYKYISTVFMSWVDAS